MRRRLESSAAQDWVEPKLVVEVKFAEWTADGKLRQPIFLGIRDDKDASDVGLERTSLQEWAAAMRRVGAPRARPITPTRGRSAEANGSASAAEDE